VTDRAGEVATRARAQVSRRASQAQYQFERLLYENPLALGVAALAVGAAVGLSIPESDVEHEWMGEARDSMVEKAQDLAEQAKQKAQNLAQKAVGLAEGTSSQPSSGT
jgi:hypothetical protein